MAPGILWAATAIKNPATLSDSNFNKWYNEVHLGDVLDSGVPDFALRYKNCVPTAKFQYLAVYHVPDLAGLETEAFLNIAKTHPLLGGTQDWRNETVHDIRVYELIQTFEGPNSQALAGNRAKGFVSVSIEPGEDKEFDEWYRMQHLDMISMCKGFIRSTRYKLVDPETSVFNKSNENKNMPRYLAIHEYESTVFPNDQLKVVVGTEWSKKIIGQVKKTDRDTWSYVGELSTPRAKGGKEPRLGI